MRSVTHNLLLPAYGIATGGTRFKPFEVARGCLERSLERIRDVRLSCCHPQFDFRADGGAVMTWKLPPNA